MMRAGILLVLVPGLSYAQGLRFEAHVQQANITLNDNLELTVSLERDGAQPFEGYRAPQLPDFDILHTGTSQQMQFGLVGGRQSMRVIEQHTYVLHPKKKGALTIGPATV